MIHLDARQLYQAQWEYDQRKAAEEAAALSLGKHEDVDSYVFLLADKDAD